MHHNKWLRSNPRVSAPAVCVAAHLLISLVAAAYGTRIVAEDDVVAVAPSSGQPQPQQNIQNLGQQFDAIVFADRGQNRNFRMNRAIRGNMVIRGGGMIVVNNGGVVFQARIPGGVGVIGLQGAEKPNPQPATEGSLQKLASVRQQAIMRADSIDAVCSLSAEQKAKLVLAIDADIQRLADEIDAVRRTYVGVRVNMQDAAGQQQWQLVHQNAQQCRQWVERACEEGSIFTKTLQQTLDREQGDKWAANRLAGRENRWQDMVASSLLHLDDMLGLLQGQHEAIEKLLLEKTPPLRMDSVDMARQRGVMNNWHMVLCWMLFEVDSNRLKAAVNERQWKVLSQLVQQGKHMRAGIVQSGFLESEEQ
jgi:hypothetical protein